MNQNNSIVALHPSHTAAELAVKAIPGVGPLPVAEPIGAPACAVGA